MKRSIRDWKKPIGPLNVWKIIEGKERLADGSLKTVRFSLQDIPEIRFEDAVNQMCANFISDEVMCKSLDLKNDPDAVRDFGELWHYLLKLGLSIGAFKLNSKDEITELVGLNILFVSTDEMDQVLEDFTKNFRSPKSRLIFELMHEISEQADVRNIYGVDRYISALGLSIVPAYRGQKLGVHLLKIRDDIGKKYDIPATSTIFSAVTSQTQAERAGFEVALEKNYSEFKDEHGNPLFPTIECKSVKQMIKRLQ
ncbi:hypothetical protein QAD02_023303 [Eretmocerus hayati]|uniref:Uncharacterized protein n=1 Tax=Eretmocerus hayati TaxID=131215 RepID=A0ACC2PW45_9HYME|nr:hypothetical protein QAD02_023303 [Eretmocerus hayati]